jgi:TfoX/Sxy family transcriptional regulator of competence genes
MASDPDYLAYVCEQAGLGAELTHRKMFGEYALYVHDRVVALVCDNELFVKPTEEGRGLLGEVEEGPPYPGARPHFRVGELLEDPPLLRRLLLETARALPLPKPRRQKKR